ncbi:potassium transporter TrkA [Streptomyces fuscichromogenes]|uniref:Saccharopine dehydrogenase NADP binding domain-containing protein n=1 Tax=Streptomyces fuscichromogenes TaxID=1324013 RepID=A0A917XPP2_9ACTN|nr:potassium transporter TrkA [Streptomyces fuscichromogenes]GGN44838.1 hypothetical protein GCM10011578_096190 [Streptomyces fuscichromogenes]
MTTHHDLPRLVIVGSGSLARAVCYSLSGLIDVQAEVLVIARDGRQAAEISQVSNVRAAVLRSPVRFTHAAVDFGRDDDLTEVLAANPPTGLLLCASLQSPWEFRSAPSAWSDLLKQAGFGLSLTFHAELAVAVGRALHDVRPEAFFLNACFPDAVNPLLRACGVPVLAGVGNVAVLAAGIQQALNLCDQEELVVLGHHLHLRAPDDSADDALAWHAGQPLTVGTLLNSQREVPRHEANQVTGLVTALLLRDMVAGRQVNTHLPGPAGLPGGYPVTISADRVSLRLPAFIADADAVAANQRWAVLDGVKIDEGKVHFSPATADRLIAHLPDIAAGFEIADLSSAGVRMAELRTRLRTLPSTSPSLSV